MRFIITSYQGETKLPDGSPTNNMQILDFIDAPTSEDAVEMFLEDNVHLAETGFTELFCINLSGDPFVCFNFEKE